MLKRTNNGNRRNRFMRFFAKQGITLQYCFLFVFTMFVFIALESSFHFFYN